jgi:fido (protein-threonine AMPylation protein)
VCVCAEPKTPPYFGPSSNIESPVRAAIRKFMAEARNEFAHHPMRHVLDNCKTRSLHESLPGADVYNTLGSHEGETSSPSATGHSNAGGGGGSFGASRSYISPSSVQQIQMSRVVGFGGRGYWGSSRKRLVTEEESALVSRLCGEFVNEAKKSGDRLCWLTIANILKLHQSLQLESNVLRGAFRQSLAVGSHQFYTFYRVFMPHEEIADAMQELVQVLQTDEWRSQHMVLKAFVVFAVLVYYIHPFQDGNGRSSRMLANLIVWLSGLPMILSHTDKIITLSEFVRRAASKVK